MSRSSSGFLIDLLLSTIPGVMLVLAFPVYDLGFLAWIGMIPLLIALNRKGCFQGFCLAQACGMLVIMGVFQWILEIEKYTILHHVLAVTYFGVYFGFFGLIFCFISKRKGNKTAFLSAPFIWVSLEYLKSNLSFMALPWVLLGHSQYQYPLIIQIADIAGVYGISFLIVMVNSVVAFGFSELFSGSGATFRKLNPAGIRKAGLSLLPAAFLVAAVLIYGHTKLSEPIEGETAKVSVVQGNIDQSIKWDRKYAGFIMRTYADLTREAMTENPCLIVWPEAATPKSIFENRQVLYTVSNISRETSTPILLGTSVQGKFEKNGKKEIAYRNSAGLILPDMTSGEIIHYEKIRLLPFGEYLPFKRTVPWNWLGISKSDGFIPGDKSTVFDLPEFTFGVTICWENIFPDLVRRLMQNGAQLIINITNEAWFGKTSAPYQFLSMSVFRAVENRVFVVRCANTGISCFIDPKGRVVDCVSNANGQDIFVRGVLTGTVIPLDSKTVYTRYGDWFVWLSILMSLLFLVYAIRIDKT